MRKAAVLVAVKLLVLSPLLLGPGWFAISDDDFSRLAIAQSFAAAPSFDPSGTSWLPLPFHVYGAAFGLFGLELSVARAVAVVLALAGTLATYVAARWVRLSPPFALVAALIAAVFPHSVHYAAATVPDFPTAVLTLLAAASLASDSPRVRFLGALSALAATLCRYETWPVAVVVSAVALLELCRPLCRRSCRETNTEPLRDVETHPDHARDVASRCVPFFRVASVFAPAGAFAWMLHGYFHHHDPLFFVKRVTQYKLALGHYDGGLVERLTHQVRSLFVHEPELSLTAVILLVVLPLLGGRDVLRGSAWKRPTLALAAVLAFLTWGDLAGGTPTHHDERVLLPLWLGMSLLVAALLGRGYALAKQPRTLRPAAGMAGVLVLAVAATAGFVRPVIVPVEPFVDRSPELEMGAHLSRVLPPGERVAVYTEDYGYFAMEAALGRPGFLKPLHKRDPRRREPDPMGDPNVLAARLEALGARYLVVPAAHRHKTRTLAHELTGTSSYALLLLTRAGSARP
jgi:hypothetical protein